MEEINISDDLRLTNNEENKFSFKNFIKHFGPGLLISIAYLDPGNLSGDLDAGRAAGYHLLWLLMFSTTIGFFFQALAINLGAVANEDLSTVCRKSFPRRVSFLLWIMAEIAIIGADIQEVLGSSIALRILFDIPLWVGVVITILDTFIILLIHTFGMRKLEILFAMLILVMFSCFLLNLVMIKPVIIDLLYGLFIPIIPNNTYREALALIGSIIMPHNLFLHSSLVKNQKLEKKDLKNGINYLKAELAISLFFSFFINLTVVSTFAHFAETNNHIDLNNAGDFLSETFENKGKYIWALGLLASGQSSTMTGTLSGQYVMQGFLDIKVPPFLRSLLTRSLALVPAILVVFLENPTAVNENLNILQAIQLPFAVIPLLKFSYSRKLMGDYCIKTWQLVAYSIIALLLIIFNIFYQLNYTDLSNYRIYVYVIGIIIYILCIIFLILQPVNVSNEPLSNSKNPENFSMVEMDDEKKETEERKRM